MDIKEIRRIIKNTQRDLDELHNLMASGENIDRGHYDKVKDELFDAREVLNMYNKLPADQKSEEMDVTDMMTEVRRNRSQANWDKLKKNASTAGSTVGNAARSVGVGLFGFMRRAAGWAEEACKDAKGTPTEAAK